MRNILFHEGQPLLGAEDCRMDVVAWLRWLCGFRPAPLKSVVLADFILSPPHPY
jgi:hypothetical protein